MSQPSKDATSTLFWFFVACILIYALIVVLATLNGGKL